MRATRFALESRLGRQLAHDDPILTWIPTFAGDTIARFRKGPDGKTPWEREQGRTRAGDSLEFGERFFMKEAKERASGAVSAMIGITTDGIVCGRLGRRLPEAERWDQTGWQDLKGVPWDLRPTGVPEPEVDVEAQPGAAEAERRERRWQRPRERSEPVRPRDETHQGGVREKRVRFDEPSSAPASASDAAEDDGIQSKRTRGKDSRERILCDQERCGKVRADSTMSSMCGHNERNFRTTCSQRRVSRSSRKVVNG